MEEHIDSGYGRRGWKIKIPVWLLAVLAFAVTAYKIRVKDVWDWFWIAAFILLTLVGLWVERCTKRS